MSTTLANALSTPLQPWLLQPLNALLAQKNVPQTLAVCDNFHTGGLNFGLHLAKILLCENKNSARLACGHCGGCTLFKANTHSDLFYLLPESLKPPVDEEPSDAGGGGVSFKKTSKAETAKKETKLSKVIKVDQIRAIEGLLRLSSQRGIAKVILIYPAETLNEVAGSTLLKILEEPPSDTYFILVSNAWGQVLPTLRSRCVPVVLGKVSDSQTLQYLQDAQVPNAQQWLNLANGNPDQAREMGLDPQWQTLLESTQFLLQGGRMDAIAAAAEFAKADISRVHAWLSAWLLDLSAVEQRGAPHYGLASVSALQTLAFNMDADRAQQLSQDLQSLARRLDHPLQAKLVCEALALQYVGLFEK